MSGDLVAFLRARIAEDARLAKDAATHCGALIAAEASKEGIWDPPYDGSAWGSTADRVYAADPRRDQPRADIADFGASAFMLTPHVQNNSPARVLAEVEAKRRMINEYSATVLLRDEADARIKAAWPEPDAQDLDTWTRAQREAAIMHDWVLLLALPFRDHTEYRVEWAPDAG